MEIRHLRPDDDRIKLSRIYEESWKHAYKNIIPDEFLKSIPMGNWAGHFDNPEMNTLVMLENGSYAGTSSFCPSRFDSFKGCGEIVSIYLLPEYQGKGLGKKLLEKTVSELLCLGFKDIFLWVLEENLYARTFYERNGFIHSGIFLDDSIGGKPLRETAYLRHFGTSPCESSL